MKTAVIAGTPADTRMGVEYLERKNAEIGSPVCEPIYLPVSEDCDAQIKFQYGEESEKLKVIDELFDRALAEGARDFFIYCNSLAGAVDFDAYEAAKSKETGTEIRIYTPLQVYRTLGKSYSRLAAVAANNLSAHAVEEALMSENPDLYVIGTGNMSIVNAIEAGLAPSEVIGGCGLEHMLSYMEACGAEALVLACTHFPYLKKELGKMTELPLIDPADMMFEAMIARSGVSF